MIDFEITEYANNPNLFDHPTPKCINWGYHMVEIAKFLSRYVQDEKFPVAHAKNVGVIENMFVTNYLQDVEVHANTELLEAENFKMLNIGLPGMSHLKSSRPTYVKFMSTNPYTKEVKTWEFHGMMAALIWDAFNLNEGNTDGFSKENTG